MTNIQFEKNLIKFLGLENRHIISLKIEINIDEPIIIETKEYLNLDDIPNETTVRYSLNELIYVK